VAVGFSRRKILLRSIETTTVSIRKKLTKIVQQNHLPFRTDIKIILKKLQLLIYVSTLVLRIIRRSVETFPSGWDTCLTSFPNCSPWKNNPDVVQVGHHKIHLVASKCSRNHFISEKHKTVPSSKLHFLQNRYSVQIYTYAKVCKFVGNIPESHFLKNFSSQPLQSQLCQWHHKAPFPHCDFSQGNSNNQEIAEYSDVPNRPVRWSIVVKEKPTVGSSFFGTFPYDRIPKATKDVSVHFFIPNCNSYKL
jgi:hypothetical protein